MDFIYNAGPSVRASDRGVPERTGPNSSLPGGTAREIGLVDNDKNAYYSSLVGYQVNIPPSTRFWRRGEILKLSFVDRPFPGGTAAIGEVSGSIDACTLPEFSDRIQALLEKGRRHLIIQCHGLKYVNSSGLGALIKFSGDFNREGGRFFLAALPEKLLGLFKTLGILEEVKTYPTLEQALDALAAGAPPAEAGAKPKTDFPLMIRCISCHRRVELPSAGYFRCPSCGACFSAKTDGKVKGYLVDRPNVLELRVPCSAHSIPAVTEASSSLARIQGFPPEQWKGVESAIQKICAIAWQDSGPEETSSVFLASNALEFRGAIKVDHAPFRANGPLREILKMLNEMDIIDLPEGSQILKFKRKFNLTASSRPERKA